MPVPSSAAPSLGSVAPSLGSVAPSFTSVVPSLGFVGFPGSRPVASPPGRPEERLTGESLGGGGDRGRIAPERREQERRPAGPRGVPRGSVELGWEVQRVDGIGVGVASGVGVDHVLADERDPGWRLALADVGRRDATALPGERAGDAGPATDTDLDETVEARETGAERLAGGAGGGGRGSGVHACVGTFMLGTP